MTTLLKEKSIKDSLGKLLEIKKIMRHIEDDLLSNNDSLIHKASIATQSLFMWMSHPQGFEGLCEALEEIVLAKKEQDKKSEKNNLHTIH